MDGDVVDRRRIGLTVQDRVAMTAGPAAAWDALRTSYQADADVRVPATVLSFPDGGPIDTPV